MNSLCTLVLLSLAAIVAANNVPSSVPLVIWSPQSSSIPQIKSPDITSMSDASTVLQSVVAEAPEVVVAFVFRETDSTDLSRYLGTYAVEPNQHFPLLKASIAQSTSTYIPFVDAQSSMTEELSQIVRQLSPNGQVISLSGDQCSASIQHIQESSEIMNNGVTDLIVVEMYRHSSQTAVDQQDQCFGNILQHIKDSTQSRFVGVLSSRLFRTGNMQPMSMHTLTTTTTNPTIGVTQINSSILFGILFFSGFLFMLFNGVSCMLSIQSPLRFPSRKMGINKEY